MDTSRNAVIGTIKRALRRRSGKAWSVRGHRGSAWGWITICAPPARCTWHHEPTGEHDEHGLTVYASVNDPSLFGHMGPADCAELATLLGLSKPVHCQGETIPASTAYYREYVDRAEGRTPSVQGTQYWD